MFAEVHTASQASVGALRVNTLCVPCEHLLLIRRLIKTSGIAAHILRKASFRSAAVIGLGRT